MSLPGRDEKSPLVDSDHEQASVRGHVRRSQSTGFDSRQRDHDGTLMTESSSSQYGSMGSDNTPASPCLTNSIKKQMLSTTPSADLGGEVFASSAPVDEKNDARVVPLVHRESLFKRMCDGTKTQQKTRINPRDGTASSSSSAVERTKAFLYYLVYALINVIISGTVFRQPGPDVWSAHRGLFYSRIHLHPWTLSYAMLFFFLLHSPVPGLYGYAAVIFSHEVFLPHMNALSKLVIFSSLIHQLSFCLFSSLPFAIGTVQDAGLIFLSTMSSKLAAAILADGGTDEEVLSTVLVLLGLGTATLGLLLIAVGHFRLAE